MTAGVRSALFPAPNAAGSLYVGEVMHARLKPVMHRFAYRVFSLLLDLDRLQDLDRVSLLLSVNRLNLLSFFERDHGPDGPGTLRKRIADLLEPCGIGLDGGRVLLLCYPRLLGYAFNPLSVYYVYNRDRSLAAVVYEVRNTFGERHIYVAPIEPGMLSEAGLRQERGKLLYVSPFLAMDMRYRFRLLPPGDEVKVRILVTDPDGPILAAAFVGKRRELSTRSLLAAIGVLPLMTAKVIGAIHWEALKLWCKGLRFHARPTAPEPVSYAEPPPAEPVHNGRPFMLYAAE